MPHVPVFEWWIVLLGVLQQSVQNNAAPDYQLILQVVATN
jgi:hypothetical protein